MVAGRRLGKAVTAVLAAGATALLLSSSVGADPGGHDDVDDDGGASIDIRRVTHADTATEIIYTVEAYDDIPTDTPNLIEWTLRFSGAEFDDAVAFVEFSDANAVSGGFQCGLAGDDVTGIASRKATGSGTSTEANSVELRYERSELANCGAGNSYSYIVASDEGDGTTEDEVPDTFDQSAGITHTLTPVTSTTTSTTRGSTATTKKAAAPAPGPAFRDRDCTNFNTQKQAQLFFERNNPVQDPHNLDPDGDGVPCEELARKGGAAAASDPEIAATGTETPIRLVLAFILLDAGCLAICLAGYRRSTWASRVTHPL